MWDLNFTNEVELSQDSIELGNFISNSLSRRDDTDGVSDLHRYWLWICDKALHWIPSILVIMFTLHNFFDSLQDGGDFTPRWDKLTRCSNNIDQTFWILYAMIIWKQVRKTYPNKVYVLGSVKGPTVLILTLFIAETVTNTIANKNLQFGGIQDSALITVITIYFRNPWNMISVLVVLFILIDKANVTKSVLKLLERSTEENQKIAMHSFYANFNRSYWKNIEHIILISTILCLLMSLGFLTSLVKGEKVINENRIMLAYFTVRVTTPLVINILLWFFSLQVKKRIKKMTSAFQINQLTEKSWEILNKLIVEVSSSLIHRSTYKIGIVVQVTLLLVNWGVAIFI